MCLAIPGKVEAITNDGLIRMGRVNFGGVVNVGFALSKIDEETAEETLAEFRKMGILEQELEGEDEAFARAAEAPQMMCQAEICADRKAGPSTPHLMNKDH